MNHFQLNISLSFEAAVLTAHSSDSEFDLAPEDTLTIEAREEEGCWVSLIQIEEISFFENGGSEPIACFALADGQSPPPGIAWTWALLKNGGVASGVYSLKVRAERLNIRFLGRSRRLCP